MPLVEPVVNSAPSLGTTRIAAVVSIASLTAPGLATEVHAATSVNLSCALMAEGWTPETTQSKTTRKRRLCSTSDVEQLGPATNSVGTLLYSVGDPQSPVTSVDSLLVEGALLYFVERLGPDSDTAFAAGDKVIVHYLRLGKPRVMRDAGADNGEFHKAVEVVYVNDGPVNGTIAA